MNYCLKVLYLLSMHCVIGNNLLNIMDSFVTQNFLYCIFGMASVHESEMSINFFLMQLQNDEFVLQSGFIFVSWFINLMSPAACWC